MLAVLRKTKKHHSASSRVIYAEHDIIYDEHVGDVPLVSWDQLSWMCLL